MAICGAGKTFRDSTQPEQLMSTCLVQLKLAGYMVNDTYSQSMTTTLVDITSWD